MTEILKEQLKALQELVTIRETSEVLMDTLVNLLKNTIDFCQRNNIPIENEESINMMLHQTRKLLQNLQGLPSPKNKHPSTTPKDSTEPFFILMVFYCYSSRKKIVLT
jgi:hypothetical protein